MTKNTASYLNTSRGVHSRRRREKFSCCGARHLPASTALLGICRPRPLAQVASPATGGSRLAPHRRPGDPLWCEHRCVIWPYLLDNHIILIVGEAFRLPRDGKPVPYTAKRLDRIGQAFLYKENHALDAWFNKAYGDE